MDAKVARRYLEAEWERLLAARDAVEEEHLRDETERSLGQLSLIDQHQADVGSEVFEREKELSIRTQVDTDLEAVRDAFGRLDRGVYGQCETCGDAISDERLAAVPATRFCVDHERLWELHEMSVTFPDGEYTDATSAERRAEREAVLHLEFLPDEDEPSPELEVGPEEAALHRTEIDGQSAARMGPDEVEQAESMEEDRRSTA
jgi:RNA polymerase-binding transcription factor DksA